ncbi:hypothetical protein SpCBS45565_g04339 [Spizellomyces sp. 'palustris']|nr:hypothetical protein SpCBS45565_g04339 [Spizellomyces sp. 'palustris']
MSLKGHLLSSVFLLLLTPPASSQATCTPNTYRGVCSDYGILYQTSVPRNASIALEVGFQTSPLAGKLLDLQLLNFQCGSALQAFLCAEKLPRCEANQTQTTPTEERVCKSSCQKVIDVCTPVLESAGVTFALPACDGPTDAAFGRTKPLVDDTVGGTCVKSEEELAAVVNDFPCKYPLVRNPYWPLSRGPDTCNGPCCAPCPAEELLHQPGDFDTQIRVHQIVHLVAFILCLYVVVSYAVLPGRREHPADIVLHFAIAACIWMGVSLWTLPNVRNIQCADDGVSRSNAFNNKLCGLQAAWVLLGVHATVFWGSYMIWNLHFTIVHKSTILERYKPVGLIACWGLPAILTTIAVIMNDIDASTGALCFVASDSAIKYVFGVQGVLIIPTVVANLVTFVHIARIARRASSIHSQDEPYEMDKPGSVSGASSTTISTRRQILQLVKLNWRALLLGAVFLTTYVTYFIFFQILTNAISSIKPSTPEVRGFLACMLTQPPATAHATCATRFASFMPSYAMVVAAYAVAGLVGFWVFLIFGVQRALLRDWRRLIEDVVHGLRRRKTVPVMGATGNTNLREQELGKWVQL